MSDVLKFFWIAFREYWVAWVTGTGGAGFTLWAINFYTEKLRGKPLTLRTNIAILFCFLWFIATFSAWHDADRNLQSVIKQRQEDTSDLGNCRVDLKAAQQRAEFLDTQTRMQQNTIAGMQQNVNMQVGALGKSQTAISDLVAQLSKSPALEPERVALRSTALGIQGESKGVKTTLWAMVAIPNKRISPVNGTITCRDGAFPNGATGELDGEGGKITMQQYIGAIDLTHIRITFTQPTWTSDTPVVIAAIVPVDKVPGRCEYEETH